MGGFAHFFPMSLSKQFYSFTPMGVDMRPFFYKLRASLKTFPNFVRCQRLLARNVAELSSSNRGVSHLHETCCIDELSKGFVLGVA